MATLAALAGSCVAGAMSVSEIFVELQGFLAAEQDIREVSLFSPQPLSLSLPSWATSLGPFPSLSSGGEASEDGLLPLLFHLQASPPRSYSAFQSGFLEFGFRLLGITYLI